MSDDQLERVLDPNFLEGLDERSSREIRTMRDTCEEEENRISYARRILQGRIDVVRAEAMRREQGSDLAAEILAALPGVLADSGGRTFDPARVRIPRRLVPPDLDGSPLEDPEALDLSELTDDELRSLAERYAEHEQKLSALRRRLFDVIDRLQAELADRYRTGTASVSELLEEEG
jgi:hypothetical protein